MADRFSPSARCLVRGHGCVVLKGIHCCFFGGGHLTSKKKTVDVFNFLIFTVLQAIFYGCHKEIWEQ